EEGALAGLPAALHMLSAMQMEVGDFAKAKASAAEARSIAAATGRQLPWHSQVMLAAWCDEPESALETIRALQEQRVAEGSPGSVAYHELCCSGSSRLGSISGGSRAPRERVSTFARARCRLAAE